MCVPLGACMRACESIWAGLGLACMFVFVCTCVFV